MYLSIFFLVSGLFCGNKADTDSRLFPQTPVGLSPSPFYNEAHKYAELIFQRGRKLSNVRTRIDLFASTTQFVSPTGDEVVMDAGAIKQVSYADTTPAGILFYKFKTGYPAIDGKTDKNFYIVMAEGNCNLLRSVEKKLYEKRNDMRGNYTKEYETSEYFYLQVKGEMKKLKKEKEFLLTELSDKQQQLEVFIEENKLNLRNIDHIVKLINYYNTL